MITKNNIKIIQLIYDFKNTIEYPYFTLNIHD